MRPNWSDTKRARRPPRPRVWRYRHQRLGVRRPPPPPNLVRMSGVTVRPPLRAVSQNSISENDQPIPIIIGENPMSPITVPVVDDWRPRPAPRRARRTPHPLVRDGDPLAGAGAPEVAHLPARCRLCHRGRPVAETPTRPDLGGCRPRRVPVAHHPRGSALVPRGLARRISPKVGHPRAAPRQPVASGPLLSHGGRTCRPLRLTSCPCASSVTGAGSEIASNWIEVKMEWPIAYGSSAATDSPVPAAVTSIRGSPTPTSALDVRARGPRRKGYTSDTARSARAPR